MSCHVHVGNQTGGTARHLAFPLQHWEYECGSLLAFLWILRTEPIFFILCDTLLPTEPSFQLRPVIFFSCGERRRDRRSRTRLVRLSWYNRADPESLDFNSGTGDLKSGSLAFTQQAPIELPTPSPGFRYRRK